MVIKASTFKQNRNSQAIVTKKLIEPANFSSSISETSHDHVIQEMLAIQNMRVSTPFKDNLVKKFENKGVPTGRYAKSVDSSENIKILMQTDTTPDLRDMTSSDPNRSANFELTDQFKTANQATSLGVSIKAGGEVIHR